MIESVWYGCYDQTLKGIITPESFRHPAKMGKVLCERIFAHGEALGYWQPGDAIGEPFGGIFTVGILGAYRGYRVIGVELEPMFYDLGTANIDKNLVKLNRLERPIPILVQGDSRQFAEIVRTVLPFAGAVTSPPYAANVKHDYTHKRRDERRLGKDFTGRGSGSFRGSEEYGASAGQIGRLNEGDVEQVTGAITSPPYARAHGDNGIDPDKIEGHATGVFSQAFAQGYGKSIGQIDTLGGDDFEQVAGAITSPPFSQPQTRDRSEVSPGLIADAMIRAYTVDRQGTTEGNIAALSGSDLEEVAGAITSPPYADQSIAKSSTSIDYTKQYETYRSQGGGASFEKFVATQQLHSQEYGTSDGQIGVLSSSESASPEKETYWRAMSQVYQQLWLAIKPGGVAAIVVKDYIRDKKRVPLCDQTARLLEAVGFIVVERTRAMLVKEQAQASLLQVEDTSTSTTNLAGETNHQAGAEIGEVAVSSRVERLSFFRRLHGKKYPHLKIEWEEVIWAQKPSGAGGGVDGAITSPPYADAVNSGRNGIDWHKAGRDDRQVDSKDRMNPMNTGEFRYGATAGQIGALSGDDFEQVSGAITSPPYVSGGHHPDQTGAWGGQAQSVDRDVSGYGRTPGQIGQMQEGELP